MSVRMSCMHMILCAYGFMAHVILKCKTYFPDIACCITLDHKTNAKIKLLFITTVCVKRRIRISFIIVLNFIINV